MEKHTNGYTRKEQHDNHRTTRTFRADTLHFAAAGRENSVVYFWFS
jgi:hypothetical protein|tara:strand:- start:5806 stop:5943 length:138 start_codon:yes stop_codon:yes gene_type:complete